MFEAAGLLAPPTQVGLRIYITIMYSFKILNKIFLENKIYAI